MEAVLRSPTPQPLGVRPRVHSHRSRCSPAGALRERSPAEWAGAAALAATEVSRVVRERGVTAFDDQFSFVARDESGDQARACEEERAAYRGLSATDTVAWPR